MKTKSQAQARHVGDAQRAVVQDCLCSFRSWILSDTQLVATGTLAARQHLRARGSELTSDEKCHNYLGARSSLEWGLKTYIIDHRLVLLSKHGAPRNLNRAWNRDIYTGWFHVEERKRTGVITLVLHRYNITNISLLFPVWSHQKWLQMYQMWVFFAINLWRIGAESN